MAQCLDLDQAIDCTTNDGMTPLHCACEHGRLAAVQTLLERGANINPKSKKGFSPLHYAVEGGHSDVVDELIERKCKVQLRTSRGCKEDNLTDLVRSPTKPLACSPVSRGIPTHTPVERIRNC